MIEQQFKNDLFSMEWREWLSVSEFLWNETLLLREIKRSNRLCIPQYDQKKYFW